MDGMKRYNITVTGLVQGVFFRDTARREAQKLGLAGFARNEADGSVRIEIEGSNNSLKKFVAWCKEGPEQAVVRDLSFEEHEAVGHQGFEIR
jgi:acylphosphatase